MSSLFSGFKKNNPEPEMDFSVSNVEYGELKERVHLGAARMKPHYMGNILSALYYLCDVDTEKAQETILALFGYLRQNVEGISRKENLPFSWELNHAKQYLSLEELRFENRLLVYYEVDVDDFELPPITLQPLLENAVKHGLAPLERPCEIRLITRRRPEGGILIQVIDNGAGFDTETLQDPEKEEKSLACIRRRLAREMGGEMSIESAPGEGTTVTILIPEQ